MRAAAEAAGSGRPPSHDAGRRGSPQALQVESRPPWDSSSPPPSGLVVWIVLWALGVKALDAFLITVLIMLVGATMRIIAPYLPGNRDSLTDGIDDGPLRDISALR